MTTPFTPLKLKNGTILKNRFMKAATSETLGDKYYRPTNKLINLYRAWAKGGTGLIITGNVMVDSSARGEFGNVVVEDEVNLNLLKRWANAATSNGAQIFLQLNHPGKQSPRTISKQPVSPSAVPMTGSNAFAFNAPRSLSKIEIQEIIQKFINAAVVAKKAGFSGVEIHAAHGYLLNQFLSPHDNRRVDEYGGSLENRMRIITEIYSGIREKTGKDFSIALKINSSDFSSDGFSEEDSIKVIKKMDELGIDLIEISGGNYENPTMQGIGKGAFFINYAAKVKKSITTPIAVTGGFNTAEGIEKAINNNETDLVGLARPLVMVPDLPNQMAAGTFTQANVHHLTTGSKSFDKKISSLIGLSYYQQQMERIADGKFVNNTNNAWGALGFSIRRQGLTALLHKGVRIMKKVLIVLTNTTRYQGTNDATGLWLGEATEFVDEMDQANVSVDYVSPKGGFVPLDPRSMKYADESAMKIYESEDFQQRALMNSLKPEQIDPKNYFAIYYTGGHGVMWDFPNNHALQKITKQIFYQGGYVTSVCHGIAGLLNVKTDSGHYLIDGKKITGFTTAEEILANKKKVVPFLNEKVSQKHGANFIKKRAYKDFAVVYGQLITGQNPFSARNVAKKLLNAI